MKWDRRTAERLWVSAWKINLLDLARSVKDKSPIVAMAKLRALDIAMAECAIFCLCAVDYEDARRIVDKTFDAFLESQNKPSRWSAPEALIESTPETGISHE